MDKERPGKGRLFVISGPSGAGKGTICQKLLSEENRRKDQNVMTLSVSMTTRKPREGEQHGTSYFFVSHEEFRQMIDRQGFLEYAQVYDHYYGTPKTAVLEKLARGQDVLLEIDIQGALQVKEAYPQAVMIFILPPSMSVLRQRLIGRGSETEESLQRRLGETVKELSYLNRYDYCVINGEVEEAVNRVRAIVAAEHSRVSAEVYAIAERYKEEI